MRGRQGRRLRPWSGAQRACRPRGRRDSPGRPLTWATTPTFLAHFGLDSLNELPGIDELRAAGMLDIGPAVLGEGTELVVEEAEPDEFEE